MMKKLSHLKLNHSYGRIKHGYADKGRFKEKRYWISREK